MQEKQCLSSPEYENDYSSLEIVDADLVSPLLESGSLSKIKSSFQLLSSQSNDQLNKYRGTRNGVDMQALLSREAADKWMPEKGNGHFLAGYVISVIRELALFLEKEQGKLHNNEPADLAILYNLMKEQEALHIISCFEILARLLLDGRVIEEETKLIDIADKAASILELQANHHATGGVDVTYHRHVCEALRATLTNMKQHQNLRNASTLPDSTKFAAIPCL